MMVRTVDASALGALLFGEPAGREMARALSEGPLVAPALLPFEIASTCLKKTASHPEQSDAILDAFRLFQRLSVNIVEVNHPGTVVLA